MVTQSNGNGFALYNGVKLPNIESVWDRNIYEHAVVYTEWFKDSPYLAVTSTKAYWTGSSLKNTETGVPVAVYKIDESGTGWTLYSSSNTTYAYLSYDCQSADWASYDLMDSTDNIHLAASDPIPLDGMNVIEWDGDTTGLENAGMLYKVSDLITASDGYAVAAWSDIKETHRLAYNDIFGFYSAPAGAPFYVGLASGNASIADGTWFYADPEENVRTSLFAYTVSDTPEHPDDPLVHNITVSGVTSVRLTTAGKYCDRDILVTVTETEYPVVTRIDYSGLADGNFTATSSDGVADTYGVQFDSDDRPIKVIRPDGSVVDVEPWPDDGGGSTGGGITTSAGVALPVDCRSTLNEITTSVTAEIVTE